MTEKLPFYVITWSYISVLIWQMILPGKKENWYEDERNGCWWWLWWCTWSFWLVCRRKRGETRHDHIRGMKESQSCFCCSSILMIVLSLSRLRGKKTPAHKWWSNGKILIEWKLRGIGGPKQDWMRNFEQKRGFWLLHIRVVPRVDANTIFGSFQMNAITQNSVQKHQIFTFQDLILWYH